MGIFVYFDTCALNRIFDDQSQPRIFLEATAMQIAFNYIENHVIDVVASEVLALENQRNPFPERQVFVAKVLETATKRVAVDLKIVERAKNIERAGIKGFDALHLACAEAAGAMYFVTCDDTVIKRYKGRLDLKAPPGFISAIIEP